MKRAGLLRAWTPMEADVRPTLLGVVTLMFLLLFFLLTTSSGMRLGVIELRLGSPADLAPLPHTGLVKDLEVRLRGSALTLVFQVATTDISASATSVEERTVEVAPLTDGRPDLAGLLAAVEEVHGIDPSQTHARLDPDDAASVDTLFAVMDVLRGTAEAPMFPKVTLTGAGG